MYCCIRCCETGVSSMRWITLAMYTDHLLVPVRSGRSPGFPKLVERSVWQVVCGARQSLCQKQPLWGLLACPGGQGAALLCRLLASMGSQGAVSCWAPGQPGQPRGGSPQTSLGSWGAALTALRRLGEQRGQALPIPAM